jgi:hypothetical protein
MSIFQEVAEVAKRLQKLPIMSSCGDALDYDFEEMKILITECFDVIW